MYLADELNNLSVKYQKGAYWSSGGLKVHHPSAMIALIALLAIARNNHNGKGFFPWRR
jgi:hypothetical protein